MPRHIAHTVTEVSFCLWVSQSLSQSVTLLLYHPFPLKRRIYDTTHCIHSNWSLSLTQSVTLLLYHPFPLKRRIYDTTQCTHSNWSLSLSPSHLIIVSPNYWYYRRSSSNSLSSSVFFTVWTTFHFFSLFLFSSLSTILSSCLVL